MSSLSCVKHIQIFTSIHNNYCLSQLYFARGFIKIDIGATLKDCSSGVLILEDGKCLTCYKLNGCHPVV